LGCSTGVNCGVGLSMFYLSSFCINNDGLRIQSAR
jgi:hypothetical protein